MFNNRLLNPGLFAYVTLHNFIYNLMKIFINILSLSRVTRPNKILLDLQKFSKNFQRLAKNICPLLVSLLQNLFFFVKNKLECLPLESFA